MIEFTLNVGERLFIGGSIIVEHIQKTHPKAIAAHCVKLGIEAPDNIPIFRGELLRENTDPFSGLQGTN